MIPFELGGQNQQSGQDPSTGCPLESYVFETTEVKDHEAPEGKVEYVIRPELMESVLKGL